MSAVISHEIIKLTSSHPQALSLLPALTLSNSSQRSSSVKSRSYPQYRIKMSTQDIFSWFSHKQSSPKSTWDPPTATENHQPTNPQVLSIDRVVTEQPVCNTRNNLYHEKTPWTNVITDLAGARDEAARWWRWRCLLRRVSRPLWTLKMTVQLITYSCTGLLCFECCEECC